MEEVKSIQLISGGSIIPIDLAPFSDPTYRANPATLPDLPAGVTLQDIRETIPSLAPDEGSKSLALLGELYVRTFGYIPFYDQEDYDQFGYNRHGIDRDGRGRDGLTEEERTADPMLDDRPRPPAYVRTGRPDERQRNGGKKQNGGNKRGQIVQCNDGTERTFDKCWFDFFYANENLPHQRRLTDDEILDKMKTLFPSRNFRGPSDRQSGPVAEYRWRYNKGKLACQRGVKPQGRDASHRYAKSGAMLAKLTTRGRVIETWDLSAVILGEEARRNAT